jgi:hypothetical protein
MMNMYGNTAVALLPAMGVSPILRAKPTPPSSGRARSVPGDSPELKGKQGHQAKKRKQK